LNEPQKDCKDEFKIFFKVQHFAKFNDSKDCLPNVYAFHQQNDYLEYLLVIII